MKPATVAAKQRRFREKHKPESAPFIGIWLREGDAHNLAAGQVTDALRQLAVDAIQEFWSDAAVQDDAASTGHKRGTAVGVR